jgi:hypothetical protein
VLKKREWTKMKGWNEYSILMCKELVLFFGSYRQKHEEIQRLVFFLPLAYFNIS